MNIAEDITIRLAEAEDAAIIADLSMQALAHSDRPMGPDNDMSVADYAAKIAADGPGGLGLFNCALAEQSNKAVGYIIFTQSYDVQYPGPTVRIDEIFVIPDLHRQKIGMRMMVSFAKLAGDIGWMALHWNVDRLDIDARVFFDMLMNDSFKLNRLCYSIEGDEIKNLANRG